jgi:hypothetical protein
VLVELHIRDKLTIEIPDFLATDTVRCSKHEPDRWVRPADWHKNGSEYLRFVNAAIRQALLTKARQPDDGGQLLTGWTERPYQSKDMP